MRSLALATFLLLIGVGCGGPSEDGVKCASDDDCVNRCIDAVCRTPRAEGSFCAHRGQCDANMECGSWNNKGYCASRCTNDAQCGSDDCDETVTVAGEFVELCKPSNLGPAVSCHQGCDLACSDPSRACSLCKQACLCRCSQDQECADQLSADACIAGMCGC